MNYISKDLLESRMYREAFETDSEMQKWDSGCWIRYKLFEKVLDAMPIEQPEDKLKENIIKEIDYMIDTWSPIGRENSNFAVGMIAAFGICRNLVLNDGKEEKE